LFAVRPALTRWDGDLNKLTAAHVDRLLEQFGKLAGIDPESESGKAA